MTKNGMNANHPTANLRRGEDYLVGLVAGFVPVFLQGEPERVLRASIRSHWQSGAVCASTDPEQWFPAKGGSPRLARAVCAACPVRRSCLASALLYAEDGIWAGTTPTQRRAAYTTIDQGADVAQVLDELLTSAGRSSSKRRRWSGAETAPGSLEGSVAA